MSAAAALLALAVGSLSGASVDSLPGAADLDEALAELEAAGAAPTEAEWREIAAGTQDGRREGSLRLRAAPTDDSGWDPRVRLRWRPGWLDLRTSWRTPVDGGRGVRGTLRAGGETLSVWGGDIGHGWGCGLLAAAPGRGTSLSAGSALRSFRVGPGHGSSTADDRSRTGGAISAGLGGWRFDASASRAEAAEAGQDEFGLVSLVRRTDTATLGAAAGRLGADEGASAAFDAGSGRFAATAEAAAWRGIDGGGTGSAWIARAAWKRCGPMDLEGLAGSAAGGFGRAARRPAILPTDDATGWAARASLRPGRGGAVRVLVARGAGRTSGSTVRRLSQETVEIDAYWRCAPPTRLEARWRRRVRREAAWSERFPWQPPVDGPEERRMILSFGAVRASEEGMLRALVRVQADTRDGQTRRRQLAQVSGRRALGGGWTVRAVWAAAWGGDADLVSAVVPLPGFVLPRHWGSRDGEILAGIDWRRGPCRVSGAVSRRRRAAAVDGSDLGVAEHAVWLGGELNW